MESPRFSPPLPRQWTGVRRDYDMAVWAGAMSRRLGNLLPRGMAATIDEGWLERNRHELDPEWPVQATTWTYASSIPQKLANEGYTFSAQVFENARAYDFLQGAGPDAVDIYARNSEIPTAMVRAWIQAYETVHKGPKDARIVLDPYVAI